jgi:RNA polymerase sigma-70 factor (ECF subfamily)
MPKRELTEEERERVGLVFQEHQRFLESVAKRHCSHPQDVPDIVQAVGIRMCQWPNAFQGRAKITTFLYRVTVNTARTFHKSGVGRHARLIERATRPIIDEAERQVVDPDELVTEGERLAALGEAMGQLSAEDQLVLRNLLTGGVVLPDSTAKNIKKRRYFARRRLRAILETDPRLTRTDED